MKEKGGRITKGRRKNYTRAADELKKRGGRIQNGRRRIRKWRKNN